MNTNIDLNMEAQDKKREQRNTLANNDPDIDWATVVLC